MLNWIKKLAGRFHSRAAADERLLELEREMQALRLELQEREEAFLALRAELDHRLKGEEERVESALRRQMEKWLHEAGTPVAQILTHAYLIEIEAKPVQTKDVLASAKRLVRTLEGAGLMIEGQVGTIAPFDPNRHEVLDADSVAAPDEPVVLRFVGLSYRGKVLRKAKVELQKE